MSSGPVGKPAQGGAKTLSQRCQELILRAACLDEIKRDVTDPILKYYAEASPPRFLATDPVFLAWRLLRQGTMLCLLLNNLRSGLMDSYNKLKLPVTEAVFDDDDAHENIKNFLTACRDSLYKTEDQLFPEASLFTEDSNTLAKAISLADGIFDRMKIIKRLDFAKMMAALQANDRLYSQEPPEETGDAMPEPSHGDASSLRLLVLREILETERKYVTDLETLQNYAGELKMDEIISPEAQRALFSNLDDLVGFQRLFLAEMEQQLTRSRLSSIGESYRADLANLFIKNEKGFIVYETFCPNYPRALETALNEIDRLMEKSRLIDPHTQLNDYLIKPIQRLCKYPLLLRELLKQSPEDAVDRKDLNEAQAVVNRVAMRVNDMKRRAEMAQSAEQLFASVKEWKGLSRRDLGELLLHEPALVVMGDSSKELDVYLFENVMLMTGRMKSMRELLSSSRGKNQVVIKCQIWVSRIISVAKAPTTPADTTFGMKMTYRTSEIEYCTLRFKMEDKVKTWISTIQPLIEAAKKKGPEAPAAAAAAAAPPVSSKERRRRSLIAAMASAPVPAPNVPSTAVGASNETRGVLPRIEDEPLRLKIYYADDIFVIGVYKDIASLYDLKSIVLEKILMAYKVLDKPCLMSVNSMNLTYADDQRDWISLLDDTDVDTAITFSPHSLSVKAVSSDRSITDS